MYGQTRGMAYTVVFVHAHPDDEALPHTDRASREEGIWLSQSLLLGTDDDMADVIAAAQRIRDWCDTSA